MLKIGSKAKVFKVEPFGSKGTRVTLSTVRNAAKKDEEAKWVYSNWFCVFWNDEARKLAKDDRIIVEDFSVTSEAYEKDGVKTYPTQVTVWKWHYADKASQSSSKSASKPAKQEEEDDDQIPF